MLNVQKTSNPLRISRLWKMRGVLMIAMSALCFSFMSLMAKIVEDMGIMPLQMLCARSVLQMLGASLFMYKNGTPILTRTCSKGLLLVRGIAGTAAVLCFYIALEHLTLGDSTVLMFTAPVTTTWLAALLLKEPFGRREITAIILSLCGVIAICRPQMLFGNDNSTSTPTYYYLLFVFVALLGAQSSATAYIIMRNLTHEPFLRIVFAFGAVGALVGAIGSYCLEPLVIQLSPIAYVLLFGVGVMALCGQMLLSRGVQLESASHASIIRTLDLAFTFFLQKVFLHVDLDLWSAIGASLVMTSTLMLGVLRWRETKGDDDDETKFSQITQNPCMKSGNGIIADEDDLLEAGQEELALLNEPGS